MECGCLRKARLYVGRDCDNDFFLAPSALANTQATLHAIQALVGTGGHYPNFSFVLEACIDDDTNI